MSHLVQSTRIYADPPLVADGKKKEKRELKDEDQSQAVPDSPPQKRIKPAEEDYDFGNRLAVFYSIPIDPIRQRPCVRIASAFYHYGPHDPTQGSVWDEWNSLTQQDKHFWVTSTQALDLQPPYVSFYPSVKRNF